jgi:hypothetical protein
MADASAVELRPRFRPRRASLLGRSSALHEKFIAGGPGTRPEGALLAVDVASDDIAIEALTERRDLSFSCYVVSMRRLHDSGKRCETEIVWTMQIAPDHRRQHGSALPQ